MSIVNDILGNKIVQTIIIFIVVFGILLISGINLNVSVGSNGFHFSVDRNHAG